MEPNPRTISTASSVSENHQPRETIEDTFLSLGKLHAIYVATLFPQCFPNVMERQWTILQSRSAAIFFIVVMARDILSSSKSKVSICAKFG